METEIIPELSGIMNKILGNTENKNQIEIYKEKDQTLRINYCIELVLFLPIQ